MCWLDKMTSQPRMLNESQQAAGMRAPGFDEPLQALPHPAEPLNILMFQ